VELKGGVQASVAVELKGGVQASVAVRKLWCSNGVVEGARCVNRAMMRGPGIGSRAEVVVGPGIGSRAEVVVGPGIGSRAEVVGEYRGCVEVGVESLVVEGCEA